MNHNMDDMPMPTMEPNCTMDMDMMLMYFHAGFEKHILFKEWSANSYGSMFGSCVFFVALAILYELLKYYREIHLTQAECRVCDTKLSSIETVANVVNNGSNNDYCHIESDKTQVSSQTKKRSKLRMLSNAHFIQTAFHMLIVFLSYVLMLGFMMFNVWICLSIIVGAGLGYFLIGWKRTFYYGDDHCQM